MTDETTKTEPTETKPVSIVDEARAIRDEIAKERIALEAANEEKKKIQSEELLSGSAGGHVEQPKVSEDEAKAAASAEYFKGTQLERDIKKANKKDE